MSERVVIELDREEAERMIAREEMELVEVREETVSGETGLLRATGPVRSKLADKLRAALASESGEEDDGDTASGFAQAVAAQPRADSYEESVGAVDDRLVDGEGGDWPEVTLIRWPAEPGVGPRGPDVANSFDRGGERRRYIPAPEGSEE